MPSTGDYLTLGLGILGAIVAVHYMPSLVEVTKSTTQSASMNNTLRYRKNSSMSLSNIQGIDLNALRICEEKGII